MALITPRATAQSTAPRVGAGATRGDLAGYLVECERLASASTVSVEAREAYRQARQLTDDGPERRFLERRLTEIAG